MSLLWGIDLGGTKIEGAIVDQADPAKPLARLRVPTQQEKGYEHILAQIHKLIEEMSSSSGAEPDRIGFSTPGALDPGTNAMKNCNTNCLNGKPLHEDLAKVLSVPCLLANDANCFALAEATFGAAKGASSVFGIIMGSGVGGGLVVNGTVLHGHHGIAGEWGHNVLESEGEPCYCGKRGCVERVLSGPALERHYQNKSGKIASLPDIAARAKEGSDQFATTTIARMRAKFAQAVAVVLNIFDPDIVVVGGGVSNIDALYGGIQTEILPHLFNLECTTPVLRNKLGDSAGVFGAAALCVGDSKRK